MELWTWKSYTTFDYVDCALSDTLLAASDTLKVSVMIKNTVGAMARRLCSFMYVIK